MRCSVTVALADSVAARAERRYVVAGTQSSDNAMPGLYRSAGSLAPNSSAIIFARACSCLADAVNPLSTIWPRCNSIEKSAGSRAEALPVRLSDDDVPRSTDSDTSRPAVSSRAGTRNSKRCRLTSEN